MSKGIKFKTIATQGAFASGKGSCSGRIIHNASLTIDEIGADFAKYARIDEHEARHYASYFADYIVKAAGEGKRLNFGPFSLYLTLKGRIEGANGRFDAEKNSLELNIKAYEPLTKALAGLEPVNATMEGETLRITSVKCANLDEGEIELGSNVYIAGATFLLDAARDDEGVWLEDEGGKKLLRATVQKSTATTLDVVFEGNAKPGSYRLAVYTRMGKADRPAPAVARRIVKL